MVKFTHNALKQDFLCANVGDKPPMGYYLPPRNVSDYVGYPNPPERKIPIIKDKTNISYCTQCRFVLLGKILFYTYLDSYPLKWFEIGPRQDIRFQVNF